MIAPRLLIAGLAGAVLLAASGCGGADAADRGSRLDRVIEPLVASPVPPSLNGLTVAEEEIGETLAGAKRPYLEAAALYSLRAGDALQATLQVGRFTPEPRYRTPEFRQTLADRIADGSAPKVRMGEDSVWLTSGDRQSVAIWFRDDFMFVLSARDEYTGTRALLREALGITP